MVYSRNFSLQWKRASSFATTILFLCFSVATLQAETTTIRVVRDSSKKEAKSIKKVISTVEQLLTSANRPMKQYLDDYQSYSRQSYEVDKVRYTLTTNLKEAEQVNKQDTEDLQEALFEKFALETNNLFLPNTLAFQEKLLQFIKRYEQQAKLPVSNPIPGVGPVGGYYVFMRRALSTIVSSQEEDFRVLANILKEMSSDVKKVSRDFTLIADNNSSVTPYGFDHYINNLMADIESKKLALETILPFLIAKNHSGKYMRAQSCNTNSYLIDFPKQLQNEVLTAQSAEDYNKWVQDYARPNLVEFYNGNNLEPGMINNWGACIFALDLQIKIANEFFEDAKRNKDTELAIFFDNRVKELNRERDRVEIERTIVTHRRNQINLIISAAGQQYNQDNINKGYPNAWRTTVKEHSSDIIASGNTYDGLIKAALALLSRAQQELPALAKLKNIEELRSESRKMSAKYESIADHGFDRLTKELDFLVLTIDSFSRGIASGNNTLSSVMAEYRLGLQAQYQGRLAELNSLPGKLYKINTEIKTLEGRFKSSLELVYAVEDSITQYEKEAQIFKNTMKEVSEVLTTRFNPLLKSLVDSLFGITSRSTSLGTIQRIVDKEVEQMLVNWSFTSPAKKKGNKKSKSGGAKKVLKALKKTAKAIQANISSEIDVASRPYLKGSSISEKMQIIKGSYQSVMNMSS